MVELSDVPHKQEILAGDVHRATGVFRTGALLIDLDTDRATQIIQDPDFFRFSVVRDPFDRLLSAFREKFVVNRLQPPNHWHTCEVLANVQCRDEPDYNAGISFPEFVAFVTSQPPEKTGHTLAPPIILSTKYTLRPHLCVRGFCHTRIRT